MSLSHFHNRQPCHVQHCELQPDPLRPCSVCRRPVPNGRCPNHPPTSAQYRPARPSVIDGTYTKGWPTVRAFVLERDEHVCQYCGNEANTVDHIIPRSKGGTTNPTNLVACCASCNRAKKDRTVHEWIATGAGPHADQQIAQRTAARTVVQQTEATN